MSSLWISRSARFDQNSVQNLVLYWGRSSLKTQNSRIPQLNKLSSSIYISFVNKTISIRIDWAICAIHDERSVKFEWVHCQERKSKIKMKCKQPSELSVSAILCNRKTDSPNKKYIFCLFRSIFVYFLSACFLLKLLTKICVCSLTRMSTTLPKSQSIFSSERNSFFEWIRCGLFYQNVFHGKFIAIHRMVSLLIIVAVQQLKTRRV